MVDGKQRIQTILMYAKDEISIGKDFGDLSYNGKRLSELHPDIKARFWNYIIMVEYVDSSKLNYIKEVFDRLNRNQKNVNEQELRHAKFDGWFVNEAEAETESKFWESVNVSTKAKAKRMKDVQFVSELLMVIIEKKIVGFDQDHISKIYGEYDDMPSESKMNFDHDWYLKEKKRIQKYITDVGYDVILKWAKTVNNFYILWSLIALNKESISAIPPKTFAKKYDTFMQKILEMNETVDPKNLPKGQARRAYRYYDNLRGANTDLKQRQIRLDMLKEEILGVESS